jgi:hypothetical protein
LNSQAAITNRVDGKYMPAVNEVVTETQKVSQTDASHFVNIFTAATAKDKDGSNPFYRGELLMGKTTNADDNNDIEPLKSIFA